MNKITELRDYATSARTRAAGFGGVTIANTIIVIAPSAEIQDFTIIGAVTGALLGGLAIENGLRSISYDNQADALEIAQAVAAPVASGDTTQ